MREGIKMSFINNIINRAKQDRKTIVLPESSDRRVLEATAKILENNIANIILIGSPNEIRETGKGLDISRAKIINPISDNRTENLANKLYELRKDKGLTLEDAHKLLLTDYMYYACMLVKEGMADGVVSGACHSSANTLRPALQIIKTAPGVELVSAFFLMIVPDCEYGLNGTFVFSDCGLEQNPTSEKLADIAYSSAKSFELLTGEKAITAMLSHSTKGSAKHEDVDKVVEAVNIAHEKYPTLNVDGELQLDAAIIPEIAQSKAPNSKVAGHANALLFPDLDAGNIGYKLVQRLAKAEAYGPITQGINKPVNDLSRGCSAEDIVGVVAITAVQASNKN